MQCSVRKQASQRLLEAPHVRCLYRIRLKVGRHSARHTWDAGGSHRASSPDQPKLGHSLLAPWHANAAHQRRQGHTQHGVHPGGQLESAHGLALGAAQACRAWSVSAFGLQPAWAGACLDRGRGPARGGVGHSGLSCTPAQLSVQRPLPLQGQALSHVAEACMPAASRPIGSLQGLRGREMCSPAPEPKAVWHHQLCDSTSLHCRSLALTRLWSQPGRAHHQRSLRVVCTRALGLDC